MLKKSVSVIIVSWNTKSLLADCIYSLKKFDEDYIKEIIVVDNNSSDGTIDMLAHTFPDVITIINSNNLGFGHGNNIGMSRATGDFFFLINSDAYIECQVIGVLLNFIDKTPDCGVVAPKVSYPSGELQYTAGSKPSLSRFVASALAKGVSPKLKSFLNSLRVKKMINANKKATCVESISAVCLLMRSKTYRDTKGFDENMFMYVEDVEWSVRVNKAGWKIYYLPSIGIVHLNGGSSSGKYRQQNPLVINSILYYVKKHESVYFYYSLRFILLFIYLFKLLIGYINNRINTTVTIKESVSSQLNIVRVLLNRDNKKQ